jgi:hypothetical protein
MLGPHRRQTGARREVLPVRDRHYSHGFVHFQTAFDLLATILKHRDMLFLLSYMYDLTELFDEGNHEILCRLCDYVIRLSAIYIEHTHLFKQTVISFRDIPRGDRAESASRGLDYLHAKGKLRPWMMPWMMSRRFLILRISPFKE